MIILDASAVIEFLLRANSVPEIMDAIEQTEVIACPVILDFEILNTLRRQTQEKLVTSKRANQALEVYHGLTLERFDTSLLTERIWLLRHNFTSYDASYIALAELLEIPLVTCDKKWRDQKLHRADIRYIIPAP